MNKPLSIHLFLIYGHLGYCPFSPISNSAGKNIFVKFSLATGAVISLGLKDIPGRLIKMLCTFSAFLGIIILFSRVVVPIRSLTTNM